MLRNLAAALITLLFICVGFLYIGGQGWLGNHEDPGKITSQTRPAAEVRAGGAKLRSAATQIGVSHPDQILFGDLHVHTTISFDAFMNSLPMMNGEGAHPPADACDFARFCSALDFWSINDHAEGITPRAWRETIDAIRQCNEVSGDPANPDTVAFLGWEWTQIGPTPETHYGHKNIVLAHTDEAHVPARPIAARSTARMARAGFPGWVRRGLLSLTASDQRTRDLATYFKERVGVDECSEDVNVHDLPLDCQETAGTPAELYRKLDEWGLDAIVIPHGTTWGFYTPPGSTWDKQLSGKQHDPDRQTLIEIYSGHGNSEQYRDWRAVRFDKDGQAICPQPTREYLPTCWRAGEIIRERCETEGGSIDACDARAVEARANAAAAFVQGPLTVAGARPEDWLDAGQCRDCTVPAFNFRPGGSAQYILALGNFDDPRKPRHFRFGFLSSSDNHFARPGTGYKEVQRRGFTESNGARVLTGPLASALGMPQEEPLAHSRPFDRRKSKLRGFQLFELERQGSFFMTGGLVAVHSRGRDRAAIWDALKQRDVYGTTGPRILLWFDLLNPPGSRGQSLSMGSETRMQRNPIFQVRAVGSFEQKPGCPDYATRALDPERLENVCKGECYNPSDKRRTITRIEVVRIQPQQQAQEPIASLIRDPWRVLACEPDPGGCVATFEDPDFVSTGRDTLYYVRAIEESAPGVNAGNLRCDYDAQGKCVQVHLCGGVDAMKDDCLAPQEPRAWSSPIFVDFGSPPSRQVSAREIGTHPPVGSRLQ